MRTRLLVGCFVAVVCGCGARTSLDVDAPPATIEAASPDAACSAAPVPFQTGDDWAGTYTCPQGLTQLDLRVVGVAACTIAADFDFNFDAMVGSFSLTGTFDPSSNEAVFEPGAWIVRPGPGLSWYTVGMRGTVNTSASPPTYVGQITGPGCGTFAVAR